MGIDGYFGRESVAAGGEVSLHVSTEAPRWRADFFRIGRTTRYAGSTPWLPGGRAPRPPHPDGIPGRSDPSVDWGWPGHAFTLPESWEPGVYVAFFVTSTESTFYDPRRLKGPGREYLVVRPRAPRARILYKKSSFTRHAYHRTDGASLYEDPVYLPGQGHRVSFRRPGGIDDLAWWDAPFLAWLERNGYDVDCCTDLDLHEDPGLLAPYRLLLSVGHDEYWSADMRTHVESFVDNGGNAAFLSANTCWWRVRVVDGGTAFVTDTDHRVGDDYPHLPATDLWWEIAPENALTGVSFRNGGMWPGDWPGDRPRDGFAVQHADHWVFTGTGLRDGDRLGAGTPLIGYECDGAAFVRDVHGIARPTGADGTPATFAILGLAELGPVHDDFHHLRAGHWNCTGRETTGPRAATMGVHTRGNGTVFTAATTDWPVVTASGADPAVERVTRNVLDRLST
ncbi:N,N-dimethylformamidase beta subunit family domain-containing protein [Catenuloplanes japonicus]|uniref:N,N-dimethylformamidase beta subunit family domain-containing protein n=1 Tax=Catenuloplanes japonicus TaxID=33876 RepID=UPI000524C993|nr:N,N-dimethylformamidase beta subunit family domain-containing protein [Catenuloplanes japonicus]